MLVKNLKFFTIATVFLSFQVLAADSVDPRVGEVIEKYISRQFNFGASVAVINENQVVFKNFGKQSKETDVPPNENSVYEIGSISKVFTGLILAGMVVDGSVTLDDPISKYILELDPHVHSAASITLRELSTHTAGLPVLPNNFAPSNPLDPYVDYDSNLLLSFLTEVKVPTHPTVFSWDNYSNLGVGLLGYTLTRASNLSYEQLLLRYVTGVQKLNLPETTVNLSKSQRLRFMPAHNSILEMVLPWNFDVLVGAGGIRSTAKELSKFVHANMHPESTAISKEIRLTQEVHATNGIDSIGLGWGINQSGNDTKLGHSGGTGGFVSYVGFSKSKDTGVVFLSNSTEFIPCVSVIVLNSADCAPDFGIDVSDDVLNRYFGKYRYSYNDTHLDAVVSSFAGNLVVEFVGQGKLRLKTLTEDKFDYQNSLQLVFPLGNRAAHFEFVAGEQKLIFNRIE